METFEKPCGMGNGGAYSIALWRLTRPVPGSNPCHRFLNTLCAW